MFDTRPMSLSVRRRLQWPPRVRGALRLATLGVAALALTACNTLLEYWPGEERHLTPKSYTVNKGDTLYSIAWLYELDYRQLAQWNNIKAPQYLIYPDQQLRLSPPEGTRRAAAAAANSKPAATPQLVGWHWPLNNPEVRALPRTNAVLLKGRQGEVVRAAAAGSVVYSGFNLKHYQGLIIIKHANDVFSVYGNNQEIRVKEREWVAAQQPIARLADAPGSTPLYFEIRLRNRTLKVTDYLSKLQISLN